MGRCVGARARFTESGHRCGSGGAVADGCSPFRGGAKSVQWVAREGGGVERFLRKACRWRHGAFGRRRMRG